MSRGTEPEAQCPLHHISLGTPSDVERHALWTRQRSDRGLLKGCRGSQAAIDQLYGVNMSRGKELEAQCPLHRIILGTPSNAKRHTLWTRKRSDEG